MKRISVITMFLTATVCLWSQDNKRPEQMPAQEPPMLGIHYARGAGNPNGGSSPLLLYHDGPVLHSSVTMSIFWGTSWNNPTFIQDKITGLDSFYSGEGGTSYAATSDEYSDTTGSVGSNSTYLGHVVDPSSAPPNGSRTSPILQEVCSILASRGITPVTNGFYAVYVDTHRNANFCAWHSWGACNNVNIQFAFAFNLDGDAGCDPQDTFTNHSQGLAALANVTGHELSEARTDPRGNGWYDSSGQENADKCAWAFGSDTVKFKNGTSWRVQGNWSNNAYTNGTGYPNRSGQDGCLDGGNFK